MQSVNDHIIEGVTDDAELERAGLESAFKFAAWSSVIMVSKSLKWRFPLESLSPSPSPPFISLWYLPYLPLLFLPHPLFVFLDPKRTHQLTSAPFTSMLSSLLPVINHGGNHPGASCIVPCMLQFLLSTSCFPTLAHVSNE